MASDGYKNPDLSKEYFAAREAKEAANILLNKGNTFFSMLYSNDYMEKLRRMWMAYHGIYGADTHRISFTGEQGELVSLNVNHLRNFGEHIVRMITANRPTMEAKAVNTDGKSLSQTYLANGILEYYMREKGLEEALRRAVEYSVVLGAGYVKLAWNATAGDTYDFDPESGEYNYNGDLEFSNLSPYDVVVDGSKETWDNQWMLVRTYKNRHDLAAKFPDLADKLRQMDSKQYSSIFRITMFSNDGTDDVPVYEFFHKKTEAMPEGRYMLFVDPDCVLMDMKMPYANIPVYRIVPAEILGTPYGYSPLFDIYPLQEAINALYGSIMTNNNAFAVQSLFVQKDSEISFASLQGGMNLIEGNVKPEPINFTSSAPETFTFVEALQRQMETLTGINSVARGNPESSLKSGTALAMVQSMAIQFISGLQQSYVKLIESVGTSMVQMIKDFAHTPRLVAIVGKNQKPFLKEFIGDDISNICRVVVDVGNPLAKTTAGRVQMAEQLAQMKLLKNPEQYFQIINTGKLDVAFEGEMNELLLIKKENEKLLDGENLPVHLLDKHRMHILEHKTVIADPDLRFNPELLRVAQDHIQQHLQQLREGDPEILQMIGETPLAQQQPPGAPPGPQGPNQPMGNKHVLQGSVNPDVQGNPYQTETNEIQTVGNGTQSLPQVPTPPGEFKNLPTNPADNIPQ